MKLTWFGGTTLRIHAGGEIIVVDPAPAGGVDAAELVSGAGRVFGLGDDLPALEGRSWTARPLPTLLDDSDAPGVLVHRLGPAAVLLDAPGEPPLVLATGPVPAGGRWGAGAVAVALGPRAERAALAALESLSPRLIAVAAGEAVVASALAAVRDRLGGTGFMALEPGMALEI